MAAFCASEPDAGSDISAIRTSARYDEAADEWILNGQKAWATNGGIAAVHVVVASVDKELGSRGQAAFVIPPDTPGLEMGTKVKKHGLRASHTAVGRPIIANQAIAFALADMTLEIDAARLLVWRA